MTNFYIDITDSNQKKLVTELLYNFDAEISNDIHTDITITAFVDARGLACPVPLLRTKVALRSMIDNHYLYLVASDDNTQHDIKAFCMHGKHQLIYWHTETNNKANSNTGDSPIHNFIIRVC